MRARNVLGGLAWIACVCLLPRQGVTEGVKAATEPPGGGGHRSNLAALRDSIRGDATIASTRQQLWALENNGEATGAGENETLRGLGCTRTDNDVAERVRACRETFEGAVDQGLARLADPGADPISRVHAISALRGSWNLPSFVPLLREIAMSPEESADVRVHALRAAATTGYPGMGDELLLCLADPQLRFMAYDLLRKMSGLAVPYSDSPSENTDEALRRWWRANAASYVHDRRRMVREY